MANRVSLGKLQPDQMPKQGIKTPFQTHDNLRKDYNPKPAENEPKSFANSFFDNLTLTG
nr:hypothetical protein [Gelidibacter pelagius]